MASDSQIDTPEIDPQLKELMIDTRVIAVDPDEPKTTPQVEIENEPKDDDSSLFDLALQAAYLVPILGNVLSAYDVAKDAYHLSEADPQGNPNYENVWQWSVLVIDAIGVLPALGNASRPVRVASREAIISFIREGSITVVAELLWGAAGGAALDFVEDLDQWVDKQTPKIKSSVSEFADSVSDFVLDPVDAATQRGILKKDPSWWNVPDHYLRVELKAIDKLADLFAEELRQDLASGLKTVGAQAATFIVKAVSSLRPLLINLAKALITYRKKHGHVEAKGTAIAGRTNETRKGALEQYSTRKEGENSTVPAGRICRPCNRSATGGDAAIPAQTSARPIDYVMGDENLWQTDFQVPGLMDVEWTRYYRSSLDELDDSELGARWSSPYHLRFEQANDQLTFIDIDSRALPLEPLPIGESRFEKRESFTLHHPSAEQYVVEYLNGSSDHFAQQPAADENSKTIYRLVEQRERDGRALTLRYSQNRLVSITDGADLLLHFMYNEQNLLERVERHFTDDRYAPEVLALYTYDHNRNLISHQDMRDYRRTYDYQHHLLTHYTNFNGVGVNLQWEWPGQESNAVPNAHEARCIRTCLDDGSEETRFEYHRSMWYTRVTDADGVITVYRYNYHNEIESISHPYNPELGTEYWRWSSDGKLKQYIDAEGHLIRYEYTPEGRVSKIIDAAGLATTFEYDNNGLPIKVTDPQGRSQQTKFDDRGLPVEQTDASGRKTKYAYNKRGLIESMTDPAGNTYQYEWNDQGLLVKASDCSEKTTTYRYNHRGHIAELINAAGFATRYTLDAAGLPIEIQYPDGGIALYEHDGEGNLTGFTDPEGHKTRYHYNGEHLPVERFDPMGQSFRYRYDRNWRLIALTNQNGDSWQFTYDGSGRVIEERGFDGRTFNYQYDAAGWLVEQREGEHLTQFERDNYGQLIKRISSRPGVLPIENRYSYDLLGHLTHAQNPLSETRFHYDNADNLIAEIQRLNTPQGEAVSVTRHTYDVLGNRETTILPDGQNLSWLRYGSGHVHAMALDKEELIGFERDDLHREVARHQRGRDTFLKYDPAGRLISQTSKQADGRQLTRQWRYARNGLLQEINDSLRGTTHYDYDPLGRLRRAASPLGEEQFSFDPAGNLIDPDLLNKEQTSHSLATHWVDKERVDYPNAKLPRLMGNLLKSFAGTRYQYDRFGNIIRRIDPNGQSWEYHYDAEQHLTQAKHYSQTPVAGETSTPDIQAQYAYDALGRRIWKQVEPRGKDGELTIFTWDGDLLQSEETYRGNLGQQQLTHAPLALIPEDPKKQFPLPIAQRQQAIATFDCVPQRRVVYLYDPESFVPAAKLESTFEKAERATGTARIVYSDYVATQPALYYFQNDHLGTPQEVTDVHGNIVWLGQYKAWGQLTKAHNGNGQAATTDNPFRFQGQYLDAETGLHYNRFRYYDPAVGRFTTQDPIGLMGGENLYQYAPNPTGWVDPLGLSKCSCLDGTKEGRGQQVGSIIKPDGTTTASAIKEKSELVGFEPSQTENGPLKMVDENGIARVTIKGGSQRAPGSASPHVELKDSSGQRVNPSGQPVTRKSPENHTPIIYDL